MEAQQQQHTRDSYSTWAAFSSTIEGFLGIASMPSPETIIRDQASRREREARRKLRPMSNMRKRTFRILRKLRKICTVTIFGLSIILSMRRIDWLDWSTFSGIRREVRHRQILRRHQLQNQLRALKSRWQYISSAFPWPSLLFASLSSYILVFNSQGFHSGFSNIKLFLRLFYFY
jgi:hypothetical protein